MATAMALLTRRELFLLLFALTVFLIAYNFESSVSYSFSLARSSISDLSASALLNVQNALREDGRRAPRFTDKLENVILGDWEIDTRQSYDLGPFNITEDQQHLFWNDGNIPSSKLVAHVPGYTIVDHVYLANGTLFLVSDHAAQVFPRPEAILSTDLGISDPPVLQDLKYVTRRQAIELLGYSAHRMAGTSIVCFDYPDFIDGYTFLALQRAYATLSSSFSPSTSSSQQGRLVPAAQTMFANAKRLDVDRDGMGYSLRLAKFAYPFMAHLFAEEWTDFEETGRPVYFDRVLLADRVAAEFGAQRFDFTGEVVAQHSKDDDEASGAAKKENGKDGVIDVVKAMTIEATDKRLSFAPAFALPARIDWASAIREGVLSIPTPMGSEKRKAITYVSTQGRKPGSLGAKLREADHEALVNELRKLSAAQKWDVHVVEVGDASEDEKGRWADLMRAAARSSVLLGVYGDTLTSSILLRPTNPNGKQQPTLVEFFPDGKYTNENEFVTRALGIGYVAWRNTKKYPRGSLPPISPPSVTDSRILSVDAHAVAAFVKEQMRR